MAESVNSSEVFPAEHDVPEKFRVHPIEQREYLVSGELRRWDGDVQEVVSPVWLKEEGGLRQKILGAVPMMGEKATLEAVASCAAAYDMGRGKWPTMTVAERIERVQDFIVHIKRAHDEVVRLLMWEIGKPLPDAEKEFYRTVDYILDTIDALKDLDRTSSRFIIADGIIGQIRRAPLGVTLCMGPFNYPLNETFTTLIPALIMGNTILMKPPRQGVLLFRTLLEGLRDAFPPGVVNTLYGAGRVVTPPAMACGQVDVLGFIGSSKAANALQKTHPKPNRLRLVLGLDAKNPAIVLPDADLQLAVEECVSGSLSFNGQRCTAIKIIFVHRKVADEFLALLAAAVDALSLGMPWDSGVRITPLAEPGKPEYLQAMVDDAVSLGARVVNGGGGQVARSLFRPTVLFPVTDKMRLYTEEQFGPVVPVVPFDDAEEPVRYIVASDHGQQVSLFGTDPERLARLIDPLVNQLCRVNLNSQCQRGPDIFPFTGRKDSAVGTLSVSDALRAFSIRTLVAAKGTELNKEIIRSIVREHRSNFLSTDFIL